MSWFSYGTEPVRSLYASAASEYWSVAAVAAVFSHCSGAAYSGALM
jgi:hypothetical protein